MKTIRLSKSSISDAEKAAVMDVLDHEFLGMGAEVQSFEREIADFVGVHTEQVVCVSTGTSALHLAISCLDIGYGDEVLVPSLTYVASYQAISATGAKPVSCDVSEDTLFIDLTDAEQRITKNTRAIMPVHYASDGSKIAGVYQLAKKYNLRVIEDAAHAFGCTLNGGKVGGSSDIACFSFDGIKNITSGEGGAVITQDPKLLERLKDARLLGVEKDTDKRFSGQRSWDFEVSHQGFRYHMSNVFAAIGREQLKRIKQFKNVRQDRAAQYIEGLSGIQSIRVLSLDWQNNIPHIFVIRVFDGKRNGLMEYLIENGIQCGIHYKPNHLLHLYKCEYSLPVVERVADEILTIPLHADLSQEDATYVINTIKGYLGDS